MMPGSQEGGFKIDTPLNPRYIKNVQHYEGLSMVPLQLKDSLVTICNGGVFILGLIYLFAI